MFYIWYRDANMRGWKRLNTPFTSKQAAAPEELMMQTTGYIVKVLAETETP